MGELGWGRSRAIIVAKSGSPPFLLVILQNKIQIYNYIIISSSSLSLLLSSLPVNFPLSLSLPLLLYNLQVLAIYNTINKYFMYIRDNAWIEISFFFFFFFFMFKKKKKKKIFFFFFFTRLEEEKKKKFTFIQKLGFLI